MRRLAGSVFGRLILAALMLLPAGVAGTDLELDRNVQVTGNLHSNRSQDRDTVPPAIAIVAPFGRIVAGAPPEISIAYADIGGSGIDPATLNSSRRRSRGADCEPEPDGAVCVLPALRTGSHPSHRQGP